MTSQTNDVNVAIVDRATRSAPLPVGSEYDHVLGFFNAVMKDPAAASTFTDALYTVSHETQVSVLELLKTLEGQDQLTLSASMAYYLNGLRSPSALLGVQQPTQPNYYASRNVMS